MYELDQQYIERLETLAGEIQESEELNKYLEEEEEEDFIRLKEMFEPRIGLLYEEVAAQNPLQLIPLEELLLDPLFEGLFLPKILGYSVLRGEVNEKVKYVRPQEHFKAILLAICNSANFDILKKRIGQSIQIGFALSSDIWVTNLIAVIDNKRIRYFLQGQKLEKYRSPLDRNAGYLRYKRQFINENFQTAEFPETPGSLKVLYASLKSFLLYRIKKSFDNTSIVPPIRAFLEEKAFYGTTEHLHLMMIYAFFFDLSEDDKKHISGILNKVRKEAPEFSERFLQFTLTLHSDPEVDLIPEADLQIADLLDLKQKDQLSEYFKLLKIIHTEGYNDEKTQEAVKVFYIQHEGLSVINECVRQTIYQYFRRFISNLDPEAYTDFFEITKLFPIYMGIFANQKFNQHLKELSMKYVRKLLKKFTDKRGKDYQDIKKFVSRTFKDFEFLKDKEVVELFKTRRKKKPSEK